MSIKLIHADCIDVMVEMPDQSIDVILTDPPYGVGYEYNSWDDSKENLRELIDGFMPQALRVAKRVVLTCGNGNQHMNPVPTWTMA